MDPIAIDVPVSIRGYTTGGKGGTASHSTPLHRLTERRINGDFAACGTWFTGKIAVVEGEPKAKLIEKYGICERCWPRPRDIHRGVDDHVAHEEGDARTRW